MNNEIIIIYEIDEVKNGVKEKSEDYTVSEGGRKEISKKGDNQKRKKGKVQKRTEFSNETREREMINERKDGKKL